MIFALKVRAPFVLLISWLFGTSAYATKTEDDLRARLAAAQEQIAAANKRAALADAALAASTKGASNVSAAVTKLGTENKDRAVAASAGTQQVVQATQQVVQATQQANEDAQTRANAKEGVDDSMLKLSEQNSHTAYATLITSILGFLGLIQSGRVVAKKAAEAKQTVDAQQGEKLDQIGATADKVHALTNSAMSASKESTAIARRANATSLKLIYKLDPTEQNKVNAETGERVAVETEKAFLVHQATQEALNRNDAVAQEKVAQEQ